LANQFWNKLKGNSFVGGNGMIITVKKNSTNTHMVPWTLVSTYFLLSSSSLPTAISSWVGR